MDIRLEPNDRKQLIDLLLNVTDLETPRGCKQILIDSNLENFIPRINFDGNTRIIVSDIVNILSKHGYIDSNETAIGRFLVVVKDYTGTEQQAFLDQLLTKYQMIISSPALSNIYINKSTQQQKILILAAIPQPKDLRLDQEIREIEEAIRRADKRDLFEIKVKTAVRPKDIRRALAEERPQIVHFCGHGMEDGSLVLEDDRRTNIFVPAEGLAALFESYFDVVNCVVLNACHSAIAAEAISQYINYVIGMNKPIGDAAAIIFAEGFYDGLGYKVTGNEDIFKEAFKEGERAIKFQYPKEGQTPVFFHNQG